MPSCNSPATMFTIPRYPSKRRTSLPENPSGCSRSPSTSSIATNRTVERERLALPSSSSTPISNRSSSAHFIILKLERIMQYARLGNTVLIVSRLCFGSMTFGVNAVIPALNKVDTDLAETMIRKSMEAGINFFDTADVYANGQSESMLGKILAPMRGDLVIATKVAFRTSSAVTQAGLSRKHILSACTASLKRLNTDYID